MHFRGCNGFTWGDNPQRSWGIGPRPERKRRAALRRPSAGYLAIEVKLETISPCPCQLADEVFACGIIAKNEKRMPVPLTAVSSVDAIPCLRHLVPVKVTLFALSRTAEIANRIQRQLRATEE
jgi:hypothetical protein